MTFSVTVSRKTLITRLGNVGLDAPAAFRDTIDRSFPFACVVLDAALHAAPIRFVGFDGTLQIVDRLTEHGANLLEHPPSRLVRHSGFAHQLHGRDTAAGSAHQEDGMESGPQARGRLVEDRPGGRVGMGMGSAGATGGHLGQVRSSGKSRSKSLNVYFCSGSRFGEGMIVC